MLSIPEITPEKFEELERKHSELFVSRSTLGESLFRCPSDGEYADMQDAVASGKPEILRNAARKYALRCVVWPERSVLEELLKRRPGLAISIASDINKMAEGDVETRAKKPETPSSEPASI